MYGIKNFSVRLEDSIKEKSELIYDQLGINLSTAINVFLSKSIAGGGFPFDVKIEEPNKETLFALLEAKKITHNENVMAYDVEDALKQLKK